MEKFIDPRILARIKDLPLIAKCVAEGFLFGLQESRQRGVGVEFSQYRPYETGDELSRIDWKLFARSDRYFVHEAERESEIDVWFLLDSSASMAQKSESQESIDKLTYSKYLLASLAYLSIQQGDSVGFMNFSKQNFEIVPPGNGIKQFQRLLIHLSSLEAKNYFPDIQELIPYLHYFQRPSLIFLISDFSQHHNEISQFLGKINTSLSEVVAIHLNSPEDADFTYRGAVRFKDLETREEVLVNANEAAKYYSMAREEYIKELKTELMSKNIGYANFNTGQPLDYVLMEYLKQRKRAG
ncbi:DUF58 domain-containing protein [Aliikangiella sp. G2MR2-5]|uniref:DUF58 domain-containing protein n=1 Tax=Aliikangiella sp. G2MR2-5 TaxID=2788943 RepID=UPI0018A965E0|nr:DUF58 domain-containing protein [Aliikangiella sp. G2MR2-5]